MTRWLTPALALGVAASEATGSSLWKSPTPNLLSHASETSNDYNVGNIVLDYMGQCTGVSVDKESCLVSTTLATLMSGGMSSDDDQAQADDECKPPEVSEEDLLTVLTGSRAQCIASGQTVSDDDFDSAKNAFQSVMASTTCFLQMCEEFANPSFLFFEIVFDEAARCANVELDIDECIHSNILAMFFGGASAPDDGAGSVRRYLQEDICNTPSVMELYAGATSVLQYAQSQCPSALSPTEFDATVSELVTLFGSPQCFGQPPCHNTNTDDDDFVNDDLNSRGDGPNWIDVGIKYIEQCAGLDLDRDDCLVSTVFDLMISGQDTNRRRFLQQEESSCTAPGYEEQMLLGLFSGARQQCAYRAVEYSEEQYQQRVDQSLIFFGADSCWIGLCEEMMDPSTGFIMLFIKEVAECADAQIDAVNQCLFDGVIDLLFSGAANETDVGENMSKRALRLLSHNETDASSPCGPTEEEIGPFVGLMLFAVEQNCTASGEQIGQEDLATAYSELIKLFTAPPQCWGGESVAGACNESQDDFVTQDDDSIRGGSDGLNFVDVAIKFVARCAGIDLDADDCFVSSVVDILSSGGPMRRHRFLQEEGSCGVPNFEDEMLVSVFSTARQQCSDKLIDYTSEEYDQRANQLLDLFGAESCWISLCEDAMNSPEFWIAFLEVAAECAGADGDVVDQCLWEHALNFLADSPGPATRRMLSHNETTSDNGMCYKPSEAELSWFLGPLLMEAGQSCIELGEEFGRAEIDKTYNELIKLVSAPPKCFGEMDPEMPCNEGGFEKKSHDEIDSQFIDFVRGGASARLLYCANVQVNTCVTSKSLELLSGHIQSCAPPNIDELGINQIADVALSWCSNESILVGENDHHQAIDDMTQLVSSPGCWEDVCHHETFKNELYNSWIGTCAWSDSKFLYSNAGSTQSDSGVPLENDRLKCMTDYILTAAGGDGESQECGVLDLGPNVCGADFALGIQAFLACSGDIVFTEHPTPSPVSFSMSYSFEQNPIGWDDFKWADAELNIGKEEDVGVPIETPVTKVEDLPEDIEYIPYEMSFSYSFDDVTFDDLLEQSMSYDDDDHMDDDEPKSPHEALARAYVMEVCHVLESIQYNLAVRNCMEPLCEIGIEGAFVSVSNTDPAINTTQSTPAPTTPAPAPLAPSVSPTTKATIKPTATVATLKPTAAATTLKPTALKPTTPTSTSRPTASPTKAKFGTIDVKFEAAVTLDGINVADLDFTALGAIVDLLEKVFASILPAGALVRLLKIGGISVTRRMLRNLQEDQGVEVEFEVIVSRTCDDAECSNSDVLSASVYNDVTANLQAKVEDGSLSTAIQEEADAEGVSELANVSVKPDSLKASAPTVTVKKADPDDDDDDSASCTFKSNIALLVILASVFLFGGLF